MCQNPNLDVMVLGCGVFGNQLGHESRTLGFLCTVLVYGISALIEKKNGHRASSLFPPCEDTTRKWLFVSQKEDLLK